MTKTKKTKAALKCGVLGCTNTVVGYFIEKTDVTSSTTTGTIPTRNDTCWCEEHEDTLKGHTSGKGTYYVV